MKEELKTAWVGKEPKNTEKLREERVTEGLELKIHPEFEKLIPPLRGDEQVSLHLSLWKEGCRDALIVWNGYIIDGHNRYKFCKQKNIPFKIIERHFADEKEAKLWMIDNQMARRNIESAARISLALLKEGLLRDDAEERQQGSQFQKSNTVVPDLAPQQKLFEAGKVRDIIAKDAGVSHGTVDKFLFIKKHASEEEIQRLCSGERDADGNKLSIDGLHKKIKKEITQKDLHARGIQTDRYRVIYIDPPRDLSCHEMGFMPICDLAKKDAVIFLWSNIFSLKESMKLMETWGFHYNSILIWDMEKPYHWPYADIQHELLLIGDRGDIMKTQPDNGKKLPALIKEAREEGDDYFRSNKFKELIDSIYTQGEKLDLFAKTKSKGWDVYMAQDTQPSDNLK